MKVNKIYQGDCLEVLKTLPDESIDAIVTDPPYELGFMGKKWDASGIAYNVGMWKECLRVLKPGGHLLSFGGCRTYHRMAVAIEDAGFEVRDMLEWVYACVSDDTEILTEKGFRHLYKTKQYDRIAVYDIKKNIYQWEKPQRWNEYNIQQDTLYRIKSDNTDQIVTGNHRVLVEREGKLIFIQAKECSEMELVPYLQDDFYCLPKRQSSLLLKLLQWKSPFKGFSRESKDKSSEVVRGKKAKSTNGNDGRKKQSLERWAYLQKAKRQICRPINKICQMSERLFGYGTKGWLCNGSSFMDSSTTWQVFGAHRNSPPYQSRCNRQQDRELNAIQDERGTQEIRTRSGYKTTLATVTPITYSGKVFCPTVSTGAWVARRNGKIFITGNSGFPKSLNVGKAVDKLQGNEREVVGTETTPYKVDGKAKEGVSLVGSVRGDFCKQMDENGYRINIVTKGNSKWEGFGSALKPAHEPIILARRPLECKTIVENVLKWGCGGLDIDGCRIPTSEEIKPSTMPDLRDVGRKSKEAIGIDKLSFGQVTNAKRLEYNPSTQGRFPANILCTDDALNDGVMTKSGSMNGTYKNTLMANKAGVRDGKEIHLQQVGDSGSKSRYFSIDVWAEKYGLLQFPKASKKERNEGCEGLEGKEKDTKILPNRKCLKCGEWENKGAGNGVDFCKCEEPEFEDKTIRTFKNHHPTVKPVHLMSWLVRLVSKEGDIVLDPFIGSGTTAVACKKLKRNYIGIELDAEYIKIAEARINAVVIPML